MNIGRIKTTNHNFATIVKQFLNETAYDAFSIKSAAFKAAYMPGVADEKVIFCHQVANLPSMPASDKPVGRRMKKIKT